MNLKLSTWTLFAIIFMVVYIGISLDEPGDGECNPITYVCGWVVLITCFVTDAIRNFLKG